MEESQDEDERLFLSAFLGRLPSSAAGPVLMKVLAGERRASRVMFEAAIVAGTSPEREHRKRALERVAAARVRKERVPGFPEVLGSLLCIARANKERQCAEHMPVVALERGLEATLR